MSQSKSKQENTISSKMVFSYSSKKKILTRDWKEEEENLSMNKKVSKPSTHHKKSVTFCKEVAEIIETTIKKDLPQVNTPSTSGTHLKNCKEHIKTPYSKKRREDMDDIEVNKFEEENSTKEERENVSLPSSPHFKELENEKEEETNMDTLENSKEEKEMNKTTSIE